MSHGSLPRGSSMLIKSHKTSFFGTLFLQSSSSLSSVLVLSQNSLVIGRRKDLTPMKRMEKVSGILMGSPHLQFRILLDLKTTRIS